jgi:Flp pilus assembly secretin CpaC
MQAGLFQRLSRQAAVFILVIYGTPAASAAGSSRLSVTVNEARVVQLLSAAETIVLGNPLIADVNAQPSSPALVVTGKSAGETNLIALDADGQELLNTRISVHGPRDDTVSVFTGGMQQVLHCVPLCDKAAGEGSSVPLPGSLQKKAEPAR